MPPVQPTETTQTTLIQLYQLRDQCQNSYHSVSLPWQWLRQLRTEAGQPDAIAALILADVVQWWTPELEARTGYLRPKFAGDLPQLNYADYVEKAGWTLLEVCQAFDRLEQEGLITRIFCLNERTVKAKFEVNSDSHLQPIHPSLKSGLQSANSTELMFVNLHLDRLLDKLGLPALKLQISTTSLTAQSSTAQSSTAQLLTPELPTLESRLGQDLERKKEDNLDHRSRQPPHAAAPAQHLSKISPNDRINAPLASSHSQPQLDKLGLMVKMGQGRFVQFDNPELQTIHIAIIKRKLPEWRDRIFPSYQQYLEYIYWLLQSTEGWSQPCQDPQAYARKVILDLWNGKGHPSWAKFIDGEPAIETSNQLGFNELFTTNTTISTEEKLRQAAIQAGFDDVFP